MTNGLCDINVLNSIIDSQFELLERDYSDVIAESADKKAQREIDRSNRAFFPISAKKFNGTVLTSVKRSMQVVNGLTFYVVAVNTIAYLNGERVESPYEKIPTMRFNAVSNVWETCNAKGERTAKWIDSAKITLLESVLRKVDTVNLWGNKASDYVSNASAQQIVSTYTASYTPNAAK